MFGRGVLRLLAVIAVVAVLAGIGVSVYNAGVNEGITEAARAAQAAGEDPAVVYPPYAGPYGYGGGWGFGPFGIIFGILGIFLIFGLLRAAFGGRRWGGGPGGPGGWDGPGGPGGHGWDRGERIAEMHRELHRRDDQPRDQSQASAG